MLRCNSYNDDGVNKIICDFIRQYCKHAFIAFCGTSHRKTSVQARLERTYNWAVLEEIVRFDCRTNDSVVIIVMMWLIFLFKV